MCAICGYGAAAFVPSLALERVLYYRELHDGCYAPATYYAAKFIEEGVLATVTSLLFCVIVHFGCALQGNIFRVCCLLLPDDYAGEYTGVRSGGSHAYNGGG